MKKLWLDWPLKQCRRWWLFRGHEEEHFGLDLRKPKQVEVIPTVVSSRFKPRKGAPNNPKPVLLHIGLAPNKNLSGHAAAIEGMDIQRRRIIGEPSAADRAMLESKGIDYEWKSRLSDAEMQDAYATSDVLTRDLNDSRGQGGGGACCDKRDCPDVKRAMPSWPTQIERIKKNDGSVDPSFQCDVSLLANSEPCQRYSLYSKIQEIKPDRKA